jgi:hypothetical protein
MAEVGDAREKRPDGLVWPESTAAGLSARSSISASSLLQADAPVQVGDLVAQLALAGAGLPPGAAAVGRG